MDLNLILTTVTAAADLPPGRVFGIDQQTLIQIIAGVFNVAVLAAVLAFLLYRPVRDVLKKRTERINGQLIQANEELEKAAELRATYTQKMEEIERERDEILMEARKTAADSSRRLISEAKKDADAIKERAVASVKMEWERAENDMRTAIIDVSAVMAEKFVTLAIDKDTQDKLFDETAADLEDMKWVD